MDKQIKYSCNQCIFQSIDKHINNNNGGYKWYCRDDMHNCAFNMIFDSLFGIKEQVSKNNATYRQYHDLFSDGVIRLGLTFTLFINTNIKWYF